MTQTHLNIGWMSVKRLAVVNYMLGRLAWITHSYEGQLQSNQHFRKQYNINSDEVTYVRGWFTSNSWWNIVSRRIWNRNISLATSKWWLRQLLGRCYHMYMRALLAGIAFDPINRVLQTATEMQSRSAWSSENREGKLVTDPTSSQFWRKRKATTNRLGGFISPQIKLFANLVYLAENHVYPFYKKGGNKLGPWLRSSPLTTISVMVLWNWLSPLFCFPLLQVQ